MSGYGRVRVLLVAIALAVTAAVAAVPVASHGAAPVVLAGPERCC